jgi:hypothetical protein
MKELPILFSAPMVRAILEGRKTQTRRIVKVRPAGAEVVVHNGRVWKPARVDYAGFVECPYGQPGDRLWVRETFLLRGNGTHCVYRADSDLIEAAGFGAMYGGWKPSIFMPRKFSSITLEVTGVRVERLQEISERDAQAEGIDDPTCTEEVTPATGYATYSYATSFAKLWDSINAKRAPWASNPWVWCISFRRINAG